MSKQNISDYFFDCYKRKDVAEVKNVYLTDRSYLLKHNPPAKIYNVLSELGFYDLAFDLVRKFKSVEKVLTVKGIKTLKIAVVWFYASMGCSHRALYLLREFAQDAPPADLRVYAQMEALVHQSMERHEDSLRCLYLSLADPKVIEGDFSLLSQFIFEFLFLNKTAEARELFDQKITMPKEAIFQRSYYLAKGLLVGKEGNPEEGIRILKEGIQTLGLTEGMDADFHTFIAEFYRALGKKEEAIDAYIKSLDNASCAVKWVNAKTYLELINLGYTGLAIEDQIAGYCHPFSTELSQQNKTYILRENNIQEWNYQFETLNDPLLLDLVSGRFIKNGKIHLLTPLQAKLCLFVVASGAVGMTLAQLEFLLFETIYKSENVSILRIENLISTLKKMGIVFERVENNLRYRINEKTAYLIPTQGRHEGHLAVFKDTPHFSRELIEKTFNLKKSMACCYLKKWLKEKSIEVITVDKKRCYTLNRKQSF